MHGRTTCWENVQASFYGDSNQKDVHSKQRSVIEIRFSDSGNLAKDAESSTIFGDSQKEVIWASGMLHDNSSATSFNAIE